MKYCCICFLVPDNNLLDALPGFLLSLPALETVHRHGNHNYFKSTFMWYHTDVNLRIIPVSCDAQVKVGHYMIFVSLFGYVFEYSRMLRSFMLAKSECCLDV